PLLHLISAHKDDEANNVFLAVGLIRAHRDRNRSRGAVQNDVARIGAVCCLRPACSETGFDLTQDCATRLRGLFRAVQRRGIAGIGRCAVERAVFPVGQHQRRIPKVALPRLPGDRRKSLFRYRQVDDAAQVETVGWGLRTRVLRERRGRQVRQCNSHDREFFHHRLPVAVAGSRTSGNGTKPSTLCPANLARPVTLIGVSISSGRTSCICRIRFYKSWRSNFSYTLLVGLDTAYSSVELVLQ